MKQLLVVALITLVAPAVAQEKARGYLGVSVASLDAETRTAHRVPEAVQHGVVLTEVRAGTAAARAGLRAGDVVTSFDGKRIETIEALGAAIRAHSPGDRVRYTVRRGTGTIQGALILGHRPAEREGDGDEPRPAPRRVPPAGDDIDGRRDKVQKEIETMRRRVMAERRKATATAKTDRPRRRRGGLDMWKVRERELMGAAKERGDERAKAHHRSRLGLLEELKEAGVPVGGPQGNRLARVERKLDHILELLQKRE